MSSNNDLTIVKNGFALVQNADVQEGSLKEKKELLKEIYDYFNFEGRENQIQFDEMNKFFGFVKEEDFFDSKKVKNVYDHTKGEVGGFFNSVKEKDYSNFSKLNQLFKFAQQSNVWIQNNKDEFGDLSEDSHALGLEKLKKFYDACKADNFFEDKKIFNINFFCLNIFYRFYQNDRTIKDKILQMNRLRFQYLAIEFYKNGDFANLLNLIQKNEKGLKKTIINANIKYVREKQQVFFELSGYFNHLSYDNFDFEYFDIFYELYLENPSIKDKLLKITPQNFKIIASEFHRKSDIKTLFLLIQKNSMSFVETIGKIPTKTLKILEYSESIIGFLNFELHYEEAQNNEDYFVTTYDLGMLKFYFSYNIDGSIGIVVCFNLIDELLKQQNKNLIKGILKIDQVKISYITSKCSEKFIKILEQNPEICKIIDGISIARLQDFKIEREIIGFFEKISYIIQICGSEEFIKCLDSDPSVSERINMTKIEEFQKIKTKDEMPDYLKPKEENKKTQSTVLIKEKGESSGVLKKNF